MTNKSPITPIIFSISEKPSLLKEGTAYIQKIWASPQSMAVYKDCLAHSPEKGLPQWYLLMDSGRIIGCAGLITNDFISRMDLFPWICALYIEEDMRGNAYGALLIERARDDAGKMGYSHVYIATDHIGYYEHYGFEYLAMGYHPWGDDSRIYRAKT